MGFENAIQVAIYNLLISSDDIAENTTGVLDDVSEFQDFPYVTIGESTHNEFDTDDTLGDNATITVHTWSREAGRKETKTIQNYIYEALHRSEYSVENYDILGIDWESSQTLIDSDGKTRHGVQTFRVLIDKKAA